jgi:hypothetical protein
MPEKLTCSPKLLPETSWFAAAQTAIDVNPVNRPRVEHIAAALGGAFAPEPALISVLTTKYWGAGGVKLTVSFMDGAAPDLRRRILSHMNAWSSTANVTFVETSSDAQVRIARADDGYWSYLGTDVLHIPKDEPTMNLQGFTMNTPESEYRRVVRHETGHTLGMPHEHMRRDLVNLIDTAKAIAFFGQTQGWSEQMVRQQVLTPIEEATIRGTVHADERSIMCYQIPGTITKSGKPILGGLDIDTSDAAFAGLIYPKPVPRKPAKPKPKPVKSKPAKRKPIKAKPVKSKPVKAKPVKSKPAKSKPTTKPRIAKKSTASKRATSASAPRRRAAAPLRAGRRTR